MLLKVKNLNAFYGKIQALSNVNVDIDEGEIVAIIGANGAGKSTLMKSIIGNVKTQNGEVVYRGKSIINTPTDKIVAKGIVYVPEGREIFSSLSVKDNLEMGAYCRKYSSKEINDKYDEVYAMFPILYERRKQVAGSLSGGQQQMLALGRGLMSSPILMLLDEPSLGLAPIIVEEMFEFIQKLNREKGISIILVEQNAYMAFEVSQRCFVLENGTMTIKGTSAEMMNNSYIRKAYLGN